MRYAVCPGAGKNWSAITLGCWQLAPSAGWGDICPPAAAEAVVKTALECGITAFDTAEGYGDGESERRLGKALGAKKYDAVIVSKIWPDAALDLAGYRERLEGTLRALDRDYVDVYLIHWPGEYFNTPEKSRQLRDLMGALKDSGKAKTIGLSNFHVRDLDRLGAGVARFAVNEVPYSLLDRSYEGQARDICRAAGMRYLAYSPTAVGLLARELSPEERRLPGRTYHEFYQEPVYSRALKVFRQVQAIAREIGTQPVNVALAWVLAQDNLLTAILGSRHPAQVREAAAAGDLTLGREHLGLLTAASDEFHQGKA